MFTHAREECPLNSNDAYRVLTATTHRHTYLHWIRLTRLKTPSHYTNSGKHGPPMLDMHVLQGRRERERGTDRRAGYFHVLPSFPHMFHSAHFSSHTFLLHYVYICCIWQTIPNLQLLIFSKWREWVLPTTCKHHMT